MQYIPCNSALLAQKTLFLTQKGTVFQIYKSFGIWEDPPPHVGKNSQIISFFFYESVPQYHHVAEKEWCQKLLIQQLLRPCRAQRPQWLFSCLSCRELLSRRPVSICEVNQIEYLRSKIYEEILIFQERRLHLFWSHS